jgi:hypothetical protein
MDAIDQVVVQDVPALGPNDAPSPPLPIAHLGVEWVKDGSKWCCKVEDCINKYSVKWLLTVHFKKMHNLTTEKAKPGRLSTCHEGFKRQNQTAMNTKVLSDPIAIV